MRKKYRLYSPTSLTNAYLAVRDDNVSVRRGSKQFDVPMQTLRDRVLGKVDPECVTTGRAPIFSMVEESHIVEHLKAVAKYGYGYIRQEVVDLASDYAVQLGKRKPDQPLTIKWIRTFVGRWPELRVIKPRSLEQLRAKNTSETTVTEYFDELENVLTKYSLKDKPHLIFNVDEKGITQDHTPPSVVAGKDFHPPAVTSGRSSTTTIIGCGSASGMAVPPYFVFPGKRMRPDLLNGATPSADGTVTETGWSNSAVFRAYLEDHILKFVPVRDDQPVMLLLDGNKSHVSVGLVEWAKLKNIILFILPAHTSHILQPMDVGCYGPFQRMYNAECHKLMRQTSSAITRYNLCELACKVYSKALCSENLQSAFKKTGVYPFDRAVINKDNLKPSELLTPDKTADENPTNLSENVELANQLSQQNEVESRAEESDSGDHVNSFFDRRMDTLKKVKKEGTKVVRKTMSAIVSGKAISEEKTESRMKLHVKGKGSPTKSGKGKKPKVESETRKEKVEIVKKIKPSAPTKSSKKLESTSSKGL